MIERTDKQIIAEYFERERAKARHFAANDARNAWAERTHGEATGWPGAPHNCRGSRVFFGPRGPAKAAHDVREYRRRRAAP